MSVEELDAAVAWVDDYRAAERRAAAQANEG